MKFRTIAICVLAIASAVPTVFAFDSNESVHPGEWQITLQVEMAAMPMPPISFTQCIKDMQSAIPKDQQDCKITDYKLNGKTLTWSMECPKQKMSGKGQATYDNDSMQGTLKMTAEEQEFNVTYSGKRLGDCEK